jgi:hypothetical protein
MENERVTGAAAAYVIDSTTPAAALAVRVHVPGATFVTVKPETVHTLSVEPETTTEKPAELVAATVNVPNDPICVPGESKVIV